MAAGRWLALTLSMVCAMPAAAHAKKRRADGAAAAPAPVAAPAPSGAVASGAPVTAPAEPELVMPPPPNPNEVVRMPAAPPEVEAAAPTAPMPRWVLGVKVGGLFPQELGRFNSSVTGGIEGGYLLSEHWQLAVNFDYAQPHSQLSGQDPRLGGSYHLTSAANQFALTVAILARLLPLASRFNVFIQAGPCLLIQDLQQTGSAADGSLGTTSQISAQVGAAAAAGIEIGAGPGQVVVAAGFTWVPLAHSALSSGAAGGIGAQAGYRIRF